MRTFGIVLVVLAVLVAVVPMVNNCLAEGKLITTAAGKSIPMKCFWSAQAELATGAALAVVGGLLAFSRRRETQRYLAVVGAVLGAIVMLLPTSLIGVCTDMTASCNLVMRPAMLLTGALVIAVNLGVFVASSRGRMEERFA